MTLQVNDKVRIFSLNGKEVATGIIVNINDFREPSMKYALDIDGYEEDVVFCGAEQLIKI